MHRQILTATMIALLAAVAASQPASPAPDRTDDQVRRDEVRGNNQLALDLLDALRGTEGNLLLSPASLRTALAMASRGARNRTASQMRTTLCLSGDGDPVHRAVATLADGPADPSRAGWEMASATSLWGQEGAGFREEFVASLQRTYGAGFAEVDFEGAPELARGTINRWAAGETGGQVGELLPEGTIHPAIGLVLASALYCKGTWMQEFARENTQDAVFVLPASGDGEPQRIRVPTMYQAREFPHHRDRELSVLEMPYQGGEISMVILLPARPGGLPALEEALTLPYLEEKLAGLQVRKVGVFLPRFRVASSWQMEETLAGLGMPDAFGGDADFSGMNGRKDLFIDSVVHAAVIEVNEEGAEAAGASAVMMGKSGHVFRASHPFLFLIRDRRSGAILFLGRVADPRG